MSYLVIDKRIIEYNIGKNKNEDIYLYACITLFDQKRTGIVYASENTISSKSGIPLRTVQSIISRLRECPDLIQIETKQEEYDKRKNYYKFNRQPENYFFLDTRYFYLDIPPKIKGFLLRLKILCKNGTNKVITSNGKKGNPNITEIANRLQQDVGTVTNLLKRSEELGLIRKIPNGYLITNDCFLLNLGKKRKDQIYNAIYQFCIDKGVIPPERNEEILGKMYARFSIDNETLEKSLNSTAKNKKEFFDYSHLPSVLESRCKNLPEQPTLEYFLKAFNIDNPKKEKDIYPDIIL